MAGSRSQATTGLSPGPQIDKKNGPKKDQFNAMGNEVNTKKAKKITSSTIPGHVSLIMSVSQSPECCTTPSVFFTNPIADVRKFTAGSSDHIITYIVGVGAIASHIPPLAFVLHQQNIKCLISLNFLEKKKKILNLIILKKKK